MAGGWTGDGAVQDQIAHSVEDEISRVRSLLPTGESLSDCEECGEPIPPARRKALHERLQFSLSFEQDPWKERLEQPLLKKEFEVIPVKQLEVPA